MGPERGVVDEARRAIGADRLAVSADVDENVRMIEGRRRPRAHEFLDADPDRGDAWIVVKVRDGMVRHVRESLC